MPETPHLNQPGGPYRASGHPEIRGRERELRSVADAVRRLIHITTTHTASAADTAAAATSLHRLADQLERHVPDQPPPRYAHVGTPREPHDFFPYDCVLGPYNPLALPIEVEWREGRAIGRARFTTPYEGPPGCVHGAVLAGAFDQIFNVANLMSDVGGPTVELSLRYRRPTPLHRELVFEARVDEVRGRKVRTSGSVRHGDQVTVEATGRFVVVDHERLVQMGSTR